MDETEPEKSTETYNPVINKLSYFNLLECGKNIFNILDATYKRACVATSRDRYYTELLKTLTDYNDRNNTPLSNANIRKAIRKAIGEESILYTNNVTADTCSHKYNIQRENENTIFTS